MSIRTLLLVLVALAMLGGQLIWGDVVVWGS
jgi:hypothetical protein